VPLRARVENPQDRFKRSPRRNCLRRRAATRARERASARVVSMPIRGIIPLINRVGPVRLWRTQGDRVSPRSLLRRRRTEMASMQRRFNSTGSKSKSNCRSPSMAGWRNRQRANSGIPSDDLYIAPWSRVERLVKHDVTSWASVGAPRPRDFHANIAYESLAPGRSVTRPNWRRIGSSTAPCACPTLREHDGRRIPKSG
jgi:hypothetical protein